MPATLPLNPSSIESPVTSRVRRHFPGASNGEFGLPPELVPVLRRGQGCRVWDVDGREYLDLTMAWGAALVGHAHPRVVEAATRQAALGANFAAVNERSLELAERLCALSPCAERVRFVASGTEATMLCLRVARTATNRPKILRFEGAYHGQHPEGVAGMLRGRAGELPAVDAAGAGAAWVARDVLVAPFNDLAATEAIVERHAGEIAGIIVEPLHRCLAPKDGFLAGLRDLTRKHGIVLVFDEVVTGFRLAYGGAQEYYGVAPDLVAYGKALGGGFPIGAFAGRADLMEAVNEHRVNEPGYVWSASTAGGNPVSCAAALATLDVLGEQGVYPGLHRAGEALRERMRAVLADEPAPAQVLGDGPLAQLAFSARPVIDLQGWLAADRQKSRALMLELVRRGVFLNPMGTKLYLSLAHDEAALDAFAEHLSAALATLRERGPEV
ncbi:MAG: aminotransferase class III-fold pyridoxal phosphate-dependent enzyme [Verrucomicrobiales bacterium]|nr:aminotransferase class III-fold pyridoxal phosphate-dependent enzyme [Verrucomicrobiales bacterium]MCP5526895.1 aminotransferase class III-fold pyridoxal phosphate-dependent enzyme [Verrucomicrobiales bacterium]